MQHKMFGSFATICHSPIGKQRVGVWWCREALLHTVFQRPKLLPNVQHEESQGTVKGKRNHEKGMHALNRLCLELTQPLGHILLFITSYMGHLGIRLLQIVWVNIWWASSLSVTWHLPTLAHTSYQLYEVVIPVIQVRKKIQEGSSFSRSHNQQMLEVGLWKEDDRFSHTIKIKICRKPFSCI